MISRINASFRKSFDQLPEEIRRQARRAYRLFKQDPYHPGLRFKLIHPRDPIYSVRIGIHHRAVGVRKGEEIVWFWIGSHAEYDRLIRRRTRQA